MPSTAIRQFDYDPAGHRLNIEFISGRRYTYHGVPPQVAEEMRAAPSKGTYFNRYIRDHYRFTRQFRITPP